MFVVKYNASDIASTEVSNGKCNFVSNENNVNADCSFKIYNYGKADEVVIRPILPTNWNRNVDIVFEANTLSLDQHSKQNITMRFNGIQNNGSGFNGWGQDIDLEVISTNKR
ncbi:hypothetical protein PCCS19_43300 [Paenibacillus sp. CCS19]|nr:hypothetical protein PCCS19_43300 [Paenibacillus cellulosilyticus]